MNATAILVIATLAAGAAGAQQPEAPQPQPSPQQPEILRSAPDPRRQDIRMMELALTTALQTGAREVARVLKVNEPASAFVTGTGRARGFILDGYGVFFDVDVPGMKQSVVWSAQMMDLVQERDRAFQALNGMRPDDPLRRVAIQSVQRLDRLIAAAQSGKVLLPPTPSATAPTQLISPDRPVQAATVNESVATAPPVSPLQDMQVRDPNELYTESVKNALIEAMLKYSSFLKIGENEWLTVAASDADGPQVPGQLDDMSRILISIRGSDLAAFQSGKLTREEVLKKVTVKEF